MRRRRLSVGVKVAVPKTACAVFFLSDPDMVRPDLHISVRQVASRGARWCAIVANKLTTQRQDLPAGVPWNLGTSCWCASPNRIGLIWVNSKVAFFAPGSVSWLVQVCHECVQCAIGTRVVLVLCRGDRSIPHYKVWEETGASCNPADV